MKIVKSTLFKRVLTEVSAMLLSSGYKTKESVKLADVPDCIVPRVPHVTARVPHVTARARWTYSFRVFAPY